MQPSSSEPSPQSRRPLQWRLASTQLPSSQRNWSRPQARTAAHTHTQIKAFQRRSKEAAAGSSRRRHLRQLASSVPSLQSRSPSQRHFLWMHSPLRHCMSLDAHLAGGVGWRPHWDGDSSDWSCGGGGKTRGVTTHSLAFRNGPCHPQVMFGSTSWRAHVSLLG